VFLRAPDRTDEQRTRQRVLAAVSEHGPVTATAVGRLLGLTSAAVRRHLDALGDEGAVEEHEPGSTGARGRGRPARAYVVSERGHSSLRTDYEGLAADSLRFLADTAGPDAVAAFARERMSGLEARYASRLAAAGDDPAARAEVLVEAMSEDGFAASARPVGAGALTGIQFCQGHCPVGRVAEQFPALCDAETEAISRLLGVHVQRLATLSRGAHVCTTFIPTAAVTRANLNQGTPERVPSLHIETRSDEQSPTTTYPTPTRTRERVTR
jgi:predicted ArsR family transcriptional regulator